ncbi:MAG: AMP-binding protein [Thiolinea sp.]
MNAAHIGQMTVGQWIHHYAALTPDKIALHFQEQAISYAELERQIMQMSTLFMDEHELQRGDRIVWYGMNHPLMVVLLFAAARCGLILVPLNWRLAVPELVTIVLDCEPKVLFYDHHFADNLEVFENVLPDCVSVSSEQVGRLTDGLFLQEADCHSADDDPLAIIYTSGTTGQPKGSVLSQASFACNARMSQHMHAMSSDDHVLSFLPMFHVGGFNIQLLPALSLGATVTLLEKFDATQVMQRLDRKRITLAVVVPTILQALLSHSDWEQVDLSSLRALAIGSTDVPVPLIKQVHELGIPVLQVYGCTETSPLAIYQQPDNAFSSVGSIGRCGSECEVRLVGSDGKEVRTGENGEIQVRGQNVLSHYWQNPQATEAAFIDGWFRTGDVARCDEQGFYWFADRLKHVIISGGENIYAAELERVLRDFPGLAELAVVGQPDDKWGEVAVVVAVRAEGVTTTDDELQAAILGSFDGKIARFKHPRRVVFVDALPRTALGKVQVDAVRSLLQQ